MTISAGWTIVTNWGLISLPTYSGSKWVIPAQDAAMSANALSMIFRMIFCSIAVK